MGLLDNKLRCIVFEDADCDDNLGVMINDYEFIDISSVLPEFPARLHGLLALDNVSPTLADALAYENMFNKIKDIRLKAPLCRERYLWCYSENSRQQGLYLQALRGISGGHAVLHAPCSQGLNFIPHIVFTTKGIPRKTRPREVLNRINAFTLLNLGAVTPTAEQKPSLRGLAVQWEGLSAAGPWLMLLDADQTFFSGKTLQILRNEQPLAAIRLNGILSKATEIWARLSESMTVAPGDMLALPLHGAFPIAGGDSVSLRLEGFGTLENVVKLDKALF